MCVNLYPYCVNVKQLPRASGAHIGSTFNIIYRLILLYQVQEPVDF